MSAFRRTLPSRPSLEQQKKLAKDLLAAFRRNDPEALARVRAELPDKARIGLTDAQFVLAREYGLATWRMLTARIESLASDALPLVDQFKRAVERRDADALRRMHSRRAELQGVINAPVFGFDSPALVAVAGNGDLALVDSLLALGADPNRRSDWWAGGFHPLYSASGAVADRLLAAGAIPDACAAAHLDRVDLLTAMLTADPSRVHERGGDGQTPLHFARSRRVADLLLDAGAGPDARDIDHRSTAAEWMLGDADNPETSRLDLARHLVDRGATADVFLAAALGLRDHALALVAADPTLLAQRTSQGAYGEQEPSSYHIYQWTIGANRTPLETASQFGETDTLAVMRQYASSEQRLLFACHQGDREEAHAIIRSEPGIMGRLSPAAKRAVADEAWAPNPPAVVLMLELGWDPGALSGGGPGGGTALHCAAWEGSSECVSAILAYPAGRALVHAKDSFYGGTPFNWCCHGSRNCGRRGADYAGVARALIAAGAVVPADAGDVSDAVQAVIDAAQPGAN